MTISNRLDAAMQAAGFNSQAGLARASGVPQPTISRILKGTGKQQPETETLKKLAAACNVSFAWLLAGDGEMSHKSPTDAVIHDGHNPIESVTPAEVAELLRLYGKLSERGRETVMESMRAAAAFSTADNKRKVR